MVTPLEDLRAGGATRTETRLTAEPSERSPNRHVTGTSLGAYASTLVVGVRRHQASRASRSQWPCDGEQLGGWIRRSDRKSVV